MITLKAGLQYLGAVIVGLTIAFLVTGLISHAIFPPDGPIGEGIEMMFIDLACCCVAIPGYVALMMRHRQGRQVSRGWVTGEIFLRVSAVAAACLLCFMIVMLPTERVTKSLACLAGILACSWAIRPTLWERSGR